MNLNILASIMLLEIRDVSEKDHFYQLRLLNNFDIVYRDLITKDFELEVGAIDIYQMKSDIFLCNKNHPGPDVRKLLDQVTNAIYGILVFTWFVKDNSANIRKVYVYSSHAQDLQTQFKNNLLSNCYGQYISESFTVEEINTAIEFKNKYELLHKRENDPSAEKDFESSNKNISSQFNKQDYNTNSRIDKALNFLIVARTSSFLPHKITMYMPIYECLFSTDSIEVNFKVSQRAVNFLGGSREEKIENFKIIKNAYDLRSKYFHGDVLKKNYDSQKEIVKKIDDLTRKLLTKILMVDHSNFLLPKKDFENWLTQLLFN